MLVASAGASAAFLIACGGGSDSKKDASPVAQQTGIGSSGGKVADTAAAKIMPGHYEKKLAASQEELNAKTTVKRGGTIKFLYLDPPHFDPARSYSCTIFDTSSLVYNKVIKGNVGATADPSKLELASDLAEKWEQTAPDSTEFTFTFRKNIKWQNKAPVNGRAFTAEDVKLMFERYAKSGVLTDVFDLVDKIDQPDANTLKVKLKEPYVDFPSAVATYAFIVPRELWMNSDKINTEVVGTGPFIRESWTPKQGSTFVRNPDYWEMGADGKALPYVDRAETFVESNPANQKAGFRAGKWDLYAILEKADGQDLLKSSPDTVWLDLPQSRGGNVNGFLFNMQNEKFKDKRVRNAISMGIDRPGYDDLLYDSLNKGYSNTSLPWPFTFDEFPTQKDQGPTYQFNPAEAKKLLTAAGVTSLDFEVVEYYLTAGRDAFSPAQESLRQIGVNIKNRRVDNPTAITIMSERSFKEAANMVWGPPDHSIDGWIYPYYITGGGRNYNNISNPQFDALLKAQRKEADPNKRKTILRQIDQVIVSENYDIWWPQGWVRQAWNSSLKNFRSHGFLGTSTCYACEQMSRVWINKE